MKPINFVKNGSVEKQKALRLWLFISTCSITTVLIALCILQLQQFFSKKSLQAEKTLLDHQAQLYDALYSQIQTHKSEKNTLQSTLDSFNHTKNPAELLQHIKATLKNSTQLELVSLNEKQLEIKIIAETTTSLMQATKGLAQHTSCQDLCITALENSDKNRMMAVLRTQKVGA